MKSHRFLPVTVALTLAAAPFGVTAQTPIPSAAQAPTPATASPRVVVGEIAEAIRQGYFDPTQAEVIAAAIVAEAAAGHYDALTDPRDLQEALTQRLKPYDRHFNVTAPLPPSDAPPEIRPSLRPVPFNIGVARRGQGFRSVEILPGNIALIDMRMFVHFEGDNDASRRQADAVLQFVSTADAVIFDQRGNGGGSPNMVGYLVSAFVERGPDIYNTFHTREGTESEAPTEYYPRPRPDVPLYVLTSARSGSAAEAFAYTLQAVGRATLVGETTAGAANPGGPAITPSGYRVFVSDGTPVNPITRSNWEGVGVKPDVAVPAAEALDFAWKVALAKQAERLTGPAAMEAAWVLEALNAPSNMAFRSEDYVGAYSTTRVGAADGVLTWRQGDRPAWRLKPLSADLFFDVDEPYRRIRFERDAQGRVAALEILDSQSGNSRFLRRDE